MKVSVAMCLLITFGMVVSSTSHAQQRAAAPSGARVIKAVRAEAAPVLDGKLDDRCWQQANPVTDFLALDTDTVASVESFAYICYDDSHLYIGTKYMMPKGLKPLGEMRAHDTYQGEDLVELMLDPGRTGKDYYQLVANAYGATYDSARRYGGSQNDTSWDGEWTSTAFIGDGYWSLEMAIPYHNLGITPGIGSTWGINICRTMHVPFTEQSGTAIRGKFNKADKFAVLEDINVDFSKYLLSVGPADVRIAAATDNPTAAFRVPVTNLTGKPRTIKIESTGEQGVISSLTLPLGIGKTATLTPEALDLQPISPQYGSYIVRTEAKTKKIVVSDADDGTILAVSLIRRPWICEAMWIETQDPWQHQTRATKTAAVSLTVHTRLESDLRSDGQLLVELLSRESGAVVASQRVAQVDDRNELTFSAKELAWGAYDVRASFQASGGQTVTTNSTATIHPGGKQHIKVLNNMVSELMDAKARGLLGSDEISFMNPRQGWVYFSISGAGSVVLDSETKPLAAAEGGNSTVEAFRHLPAGRHRLRATGNLDQIVVRSVPQLIYSADPTRYEPDVMAEALNNANTLLTSGQEMEFMREWVGSGKRLITFSSRPGPQEGLQDKDFSVRVDEYFEKLTSHSGFAESLMNGIIVDQSSDSYPHQKAAIVAALARLAARDDMAGKEYWPWFEGAIFGSDASRALTKFIIDQRWGYSFYTYQPERSSEQQAREMSSSLVNNARSCEAEYPGSVRRMIVTLGYMSHAPEGITQDCDPNVDFKVLMQMQVDLLANDPAAFGVYGLMWYYSPYVNEEYLRWGGRLMRHYGIEGKTTPLTTDPYVLAHVTNGDFEQGTKDWTIEEAESGSIRVDQHATYGQLQNRYQGGSKGDTFLLTKRSVKGPNRFFQQIKGLQPGRLYSMRMITADYRNATEGTSVKQEDAVSIKLEGVELVERTGKNRQETFESKYYGGASSITSVKRVPAWLNFHWYIFRATDRTARVTISDWSGPDDPGGPIGQEMMYNFIEVQPYLE